MPATAFAAGTRVPPGRAPTGPRRSFTGRLTRERVRRPEGGTALTAGMPRTEEIDPAVLAAKRDKECKLPIHHQAGAVQADARMELVERVLGEECELHDMGRIEHSRHKVQR